MQAIGPSSVNLVGPILMLWATILVFLEGVVDEGDVFRGGGNG